MRTYEIGQNDADQRLDRYLQKIFPKASASYLQKRIRQKRIKINKKRAQAGDPLRLGDQVQVYLYEEELKPLEEDQRIPHSKIKLNYVYEDANFVVIDKPAGILSHPAKARDYGKTIVDAFVADRIDRGFYQPRLEKSFTPALVNRLDFQTAGLLLGANNHRAVMVLSQAMREGKIEKYYLAYVAGALEDQEITLPLETRNGHAYVEKTGKAARTAVRTLWTDGKRSLVEVELFTGRTHQIRAHLAAIGHPLLGDKSYGGPKISNLNHYLLLSHKLILRDLGQADFPKDLTLESRQVSAFLAKKDRIEKGSGDHASKNSTRGR